MTAYLRVNGIDVLYDRVRALSEVSLRVDQGDIVALIGTNGAGKITTLRALTGLTPIARGEIWFDGQRIDACQPIKSWRAVSRWCPKGAAYFRR